MFSENRSLFFFRASNVPVVMVPCSPYLEVALLLPWREKRHILLCSKASAATGGFSLFSPTVRSWWISLMKKCCCCCRVQCLHRWTSLSSPLFRGPVPVLAARTVRWQKMNLSRFSNCSGWNPSLAAACVVRKCFKKLSWTDFASFERMNFGTVNQCLGLRWFCHFSQKCQNILLLGFLSFPPETLLLIGDISLFT